MMIDGADCVNVFSAIIASSYEELFVAAINK